MGVWKGWQRPVRVIRSLVEPKSSPLRGLVAVGSAVRLIKPFVIKKCRVSSKPARGLHLSTNLRSLRCNRLQSCLRHIECARGSDFESHALRTDRSPRCCLGFRPKIGADLRILLGFINVVNLEFVVELTTIVDTVIHISERRDIMTESEAVAAASTAH